MKKKKDLLRADLGELNDNPHPMYVGAAPLQMLPVRVLQVESDAGKEEYHIVVNDNYIGNLQTGNALFKKKDLEDIGLTIPVRELKSAVDAKPKKVKIYEI